MKIKRYFMFKEIDKSILEYPQWKDRVPAEPTETEFKKAWREVFKFDYDDCNAEYGKQELMGNALGNGLIVQTPNCMHYCGSFAEYCDDPILGENQSFYYSGCGCTWSTDIIGQRFALIDAKTGLPADDELYNWEIIRRYKPFTFKLFNS